MHGPNGFLREFAGRVATAGAEVTARHRGQDGRVELVLRNHGPLPVRLTVRDGYGHEHPATHLVRPGASTVHLADPGRSHGWYDLTVTCDRDDAFVRRLAGHVETGAPSTSDPAIATI